jgi:hypothetical protein
MLYAKGTFSGRYNTQGEYWRGKIVTAHEFAVPKTGNGRFHEAMAKLIARNDSLMALPKMLNRFVAAALLEIEPGIEVDVFGGESSGMMGGGEGTRGEITQLKAHMLDKFGEVVPSVHIGHARHIGRVAAQATAQGLEPIIMPDYPDGFDPKSVQPHVRDALRWNLHEIIGVPYLHITGQF